MRASPSTSSSRRAAGNPAGGPELRAPDDPARAVARFDEGCAFCMKSADFARTRGADIDLRPGAPSDTMTLDVAGKHYERSDAALRVARRMRWPYSWLGALGLLVPRPIRDGVYDWIARRRHHIHASR